MEEECKGKGWDVRKEERDCMMEMVVIILEIVVGVMLHCTAIFLLTNMKEESGMSIQLSIQPVIGKLFLNSAAAETNAIFNAIPHKNNMQIIIYAINKCTPA